MRARARVDHTEKEKREMTQMRHIKLKLLNAMPSSTSTRAGLTLIRKIVGKLLVTNETRGVLFSRGG